MISLMTSLFWAVLSPVSLILILSDSPYVLAEDSKIFPNDSSPYGISFKDWIGKWWQWYTSVPKTLSPNYPDYPGHIIDQKCSVGQDVSSPVFFLFNPLVDEPSPERACDIPKDKAIMLPIISAESDTGDPEQTDKSETGMIQSATSGNDYAAISVKLDGLKLNFNEDPKLRAVSDFFNISLPEHNIWEEKEVPGTYKGVAEGYFLFLKPLSEGNHTLYYEVATNPPNPNVYAQAVTYHLNVK